MAAAESGGSNDSLAQAVKRQAAASFQYSEREGTKYDLGKLLPQEKHQRELQASHDSPGTGTLCIDP